MTVPGHDLVRELARGGMGVVHEAVERETGRRVAIKRLLRGPWLEPSAVDRFRREGEAAARLRHPGIVVVHAAGVAEGEPYLVMELVRGESLQARLDRDGPLPLEEALRVADALAAALDHAHAQGVLHRDLKPANVMFDETGAAKLTDFGLARLVDRATLTRTGELLGTPAYMPPEQANGLRGDARADVYGLGAA
jgi:eukaryotic-like serine/threonine-protein kinase